MKKGKQARAKTAKGAMVWPYYILFLILVLLYARTGSIALGILSFMAIIAILIVEAKTSVKAEGARKTVVDIAVAIAAALVLWVVLVLAMHTYSPIDAVASCSMLPTLQRGDLVLLSGITNFTQFVDSNHVPVINMTSQEFSYFENNIDKEFLAYYAYADGNKSYISDILPSSNYQIGLYNTKCLSTYSYMGQPNNYYKCYVASHYKVQLWHREDVHWRAHSEHSIYLKHNRKQRDDI